MTIESMRFEEYDDLFLIAYVSRNTPEMTLHEYVQFQKQKMKDWLNSEDRSTPEYLYGLSVDNIEDGYTTYAGVPVDNKPIQLPKEMELIEIPALSYFVYQQRDDSTINAQEIAAEIKKNGYTPYMTANNPVANSLPIKMIICPFEDQLDACEVCIPVIKKL